MQQTTNYKLNKVEREDFVKDSIDALGSNVVEIDRLIKETADHIGTVEENVRTDIETIGTALEDMGKELDEIEENIEKIDDRLIKAEEKIDRAETILPTTTASGENVYIDNAQNYPLMGLSGEGKCEQVTTTGKNIIDLTQLDSTTSITLNALRCNASDKESNSITLTATGTRANLELTFPENYFAENEDIVVRAKFLETISGRTSPVGFVIAVSENGVDYTALVNYTDQLKYNTPMIISKTANIGTYKYTRIRIWANGTDDSVTEGESVINISELMIARGTDDTFEPYTGGQASPNPDYPQEIKTVTEAEYKGVGKNLFKILSPLKETTNKNVKLAISEDNIITLNGTATGDWWPDFMYNIASNTVTHEKVITNLVKDYYTFSIKVISGTGSNLNATCVFNDEVERESAGLSLTKTKSTTVKEVYGINRVYLYIPNGAVFSNFKIQLQLEKGTVATEYEPYQETILPIDLQGNELCKVGDTADKLLIDRKGNVAIEKNIGKGVLDGSESWNRDALQSGNSMYSFYTGKFRSTVKVYSEFLSDLLKDRNTGVYYNDLVGMDINQNKDIRVKISESVSTVDELKAWLQKNNVTVYYQLATPKIISLGTIENPEIFKGINNIVVETNLGNMNIEIEYVEDIQLRISKIEQAIISLGGI